MNGFILHISFSTACLLVSIAIALKKRASFLLRFLILGLGALWLPAVTLIYFLKSGSSRSWEWTILTIGWLSVWMVLGLCLMWSKSIHFLGRELVILSLMGILSVLVQLIFVF